LAVEVGLGTITLETFLQVTAALEEALLTTTQTEQEALELPNRELMERWRQPLRAGLEDNG
jgi:hypothetical protein